MPLSTLFAELTADPAAPRLDNLAPTAALPGGHVEVAGSNLGPTSTALPTAAIGDTKAVVMLSRSSRAVVQIPSGAIASDLHLAHGAHRSNSLPLRVGVPFAEELHLISNPAQDADGGIYAMVSGPRGEQVPISIYRISRDLDVRPFVRDLLNVSALAFDTAGFLYASSRAEGNVYRISQDGAITTYAEGMGIATGLAFDRDSNLFVGDRSGTIFKIAANPSAPHISGEIFVYATLEPSVAAYHLAFRDDGTLLVAAPSTASHDVIHAIDTNGTASVFYRGLGRPQGMALDVDGNVYIAASLAGRRGIVRITPDGDADDTSRASLIVSGNDLVGLCFLDDGCAALATNSTLFHIDLGIEGRKLV